MTSTNLFSKRWKFLTTITKHFYTILPLIPSDKFWRNFCIFPWRNCGRKITDFKEWSKICVSCFFWQIKLGKNKEFWTTQATHSKATLLFNQMLSEAKQKIFQARWRDENSQKLVQLKIRQMKYVGFERFKIKKAK